MGPSSESVEVPAGLSLQLRVCAEDLCNDAAFAQLVADGCPREYDRNSLNIPANAIFTLQNILPSVGERVARRDIPKSWRSLMH